MKSDFGIIDERDADRQTTFHSAREILGQSVAIIDQSDQLEDVFDRLLHHLFLHMSHLYGEVIALVSSFTPAYFSDQFEMFLH